MLTMCPHLRFRGRDFFLLLNTGLGGGGEVCDVTAAAAASAGRVVQLYHVIFLMHLHHKTSK
jgi:hypothetical protein